MRRQRAITALGTAVVALSLTLGAATPAAAHNYVVSSNPDDGATITEAPESFTITTNDVLLDLGGNGAGFGLVVTDADGLHYGDGCVVIDGRTMSSAVALGPAGDYTMTFQFVSADGHTVSDSMTFRYEPAAGTPQAEGSTTVPSCGQTTGADSAAAGTDGNTEPTAGSPSGSVLSESDTIVLIVAVVGVLIGVSVVVAVARSGRRGRASSADPVP